MNKKKLIFAIVALVAVVVLAVGAWILAQPETFAGRKSFTVTVTHADGSVKEFSYRSSEEYLGPVLQEKGLIEGYEGPYGLYIEVVDGEKAIYEETGAYWGFYVEGKYAEKGIDKTPIQDGTHYQLTYEAFSAS